MFILLVTVTGCEFESYPEASCIEPLHGRIVSSGPLCGGVVIQILSDRYSSIMVDSVWYDSLQTKPVGYTNVFTTYIDCSPNTEFNAMLKTFYQTKEEFTFYLSNNKSLSAFANCSICKPLTAMPINVYDLSPPICNDLIIY
ncbi:MAG: hypothetical protein RIA63_14570 [Cyclobacteriaceae bacterium]